MRLEYKPEISSLSEDTKIIVGKCGQRYFCDLYFAFHCFTVHFDSLSFILTNSCTNSYNNTNTKLAFAQQTQYNNNN